MLDPIRQTDEGARRLAKTLIHGTRAGSLATLRPDGHPFASLVAVAPDFGGAPVILVSSLSGHATNLAADGRCTLLCASVGKGDPLAHPRVSVICQARRLARQSKEGARAQRRFLAFNPKAELYANFPDFSFYALDIMRASLNGGFGKAYELRCEDILSAPAGTQALGDAEPLLLTQLNVERAPLLQRLAIRYAETVAAAEDQPEISKGKWRACGVDPEGIDVVSSAGNGRIHFAAHVTSPAAFWETIEQLVNQSSAP
jgi:heme iron utilization protein